MKENNEHNAHVIFVYYVQGYDFALCENIWCENGLYEMHLEQIQ